MPLMRSLLTAVLLSVGRLAVAQTLKVDGREVAANASTVAPAAAVADAPAAAAAAGLFTEENVQLTDAVLANLTALELSNISLFSFEDSYSVAKRSLFGRCKTYPGDFLYPTDLIWNIFDLLLGGALTKTVPEASVCYNDFGNFDKAKCDFLTANWVNGSYIHTEDPTAINAVLFEGLSCMPPTINVGETDCKVGGLPSYVVEATQVAHIQLAVNFARNLNLRLVVKNTGHDFGAKSTGAGSLSIWTHKLNNIQYLESYQQDSYSGPALKLGSGVRAFEVYEAANKYGVTAVGGEGQTVGIIGGYVLGGGHSPMSGLWGMAADSVLSFEVVTADGRFLTASESQNPDLFWALRGGGGSTYGVVTSAVVKVFPKINITTMTFAFSTGANVTNDQFWAALRAYFDGFIEYAVDNANYEYFRIQNLGTSLAFDMGPWWAPNMTEAQLRELTAPLFAKWAEIGVKVEPVYTEYDNFHDAWLTSFPLEPWGSNAIRQGSRLFPKANWEDETKLNATFEAIKSVVEDGGLIIAFNIMAAPKTGFPDNAVNPAWREAVMHCIAAVLWDPTAEESVRKAASDKLTFDWVQSWRDVSPGAGAYMSESDYIEPNFTQAFWGTKYEKALDLKKKYDPNDVFYAQNAVGSENWEMSEMILGNLPSQNSKLCRKQ
ncbi:FAD binding domain-containing protein [Colletotrichum graminicola]|uniref:FAD binding domain-containing protein n=1 Tax=Colletotrichum graminicola (strain M1.001 / M2 / FGSC 10212) TaxID=645133 RepID=E3QAW1_COLGM|nr:FAD binding domain-containing protein [Colletotrichum graminicola M1.001]EFQ27999.1 FAD binding domain-containing protein [Colletotrichum graminicola M1.001]WDK12051.1 FAD binding domain-containing protein [Colletotrichum graminicola]